MAVPNKPLEERFRISGWTNEAELARLADINGSLLEPVGKLLCILALLGTVILGLMTAKDWYRQHEHCTKRVPSMHKSALEFCRSLHVKSNALKQDQQTAERRCQKSTAGHTTQSYCASLNADWVGQGLSALALLGLSLFFCLLWVWGRTRIPRFVRILQREAHSVVWIYVMNFQRKNVPDAKEVMLGMESGREIMIVTAAEMRAADVVQSISAICPQATTGYSDHNRDRFRNSPASLRHS